MSNIRNFFPISKCIDWSDEESPKKKRKTEAITTGGYESEEYASGDETSDEAVENSDVTNQADEESNASDDQSDDGTTDEILNTTQSGSEESDIEGNDDSDVQNDTHDDESDAEDDENPFKVGCSGSTIEEKRYLKATMTLSDEQKEVFDYVIRVIGDPKFRRKNPTTVLVEGPAGTGKTELLKRLCDFVQINQKQKAVFVAASGVAALNYPYGRTAHSMFRFPLSLPTKSFCEINDEVFESSIIVYDEAQMINGTLIKMLDRSLKKVMSSKKPFGGKIIVFAADLRQVAPVLKNTSVDDIFHFFDLEELLLNPEEFFDKAEIKKFELNSPYENADRGYFDFLKTLKSIKYADEPVMLYHIGYRTSINDMIDFVYPNDILTSPDMCARRAILAPTNVKADEINEKIVARVSRRANTFIMRSEDSGKSDLNVNEGPDKVFPGSEIHLWKGCVCMVIRNMYDPVTLLNGAKVIVEKIVDSDTILVRKPNQHETICIKKQMFVRYARNYISNKRLKQERMQFPLTLCYATTIHKSQGQTFDRAGIDLTEGVFCHGQLYLALSRVRHRQDMMVCVKKQQVHNNVAQVKNVVSSSLMY